VDANIFEVNFSPGVFSPTTDADKVLEQDPLDTHILWQELVDTTNIGAGPTYYPSSAGQAMAGFKDLALAMVNTGGVTVTVEVTDDDAAVPDWIDITKAGYDEATNTSGNASYVDTTSSVAWDNLNHTYWRVKVVGDGSNAVQIHARMKAL
jgi:hypothetical protein